MHSSWIILSTLAAHPLAFRFHPTWHLWVGFALLHGKCSCWGISCQGLSNRLDKGVYLFIPAEVLDWSWSRSICVLTGMSAGGGTWLLWRAAMHSWLLSSSQPRNIACWCVMRSFTMWFTLYLLPWMSAYTKLWPALTQCSKIGIYSHSWSSFLLWLISSVWMGVREQPPLSTETSTWDWRCCRHRFPHEISAEVTMRKTSFLESQGCGWLWGIASKQLAIVYLKRGSPSTERIFVDSFVWILR